MVHLKKLIKREQDIVRDLASSASPLASPANPPEPDTGNKDPLLAHSDLIPPPSSGGAPPEQHPSPPSNPPPPGGGSSSGKSMAADTPIVPKPGQEIPPIPPQSPPDPSPATASDDKPFGKGNAPQPPPQPGEGAGSKPGDSPAALAAQAQADIAQELAQMQDQPGSEPGSNTPLGEAQAAAHASAAALAAGDRPGALNAARNAEAAMLRAHEALAEAAGAQMRDALAQAQQQLQDTAQAQRKALTPAAQAQVAQQAQAIQDALTRAREDQTASGDPQLASLADSLLRKYGDSGIPAKLEGLGRLSATSDGDRVGAADMMLKFAANMASSRLAMQSEAKNLEDVIKRIDRVQHNMDQSRGTPEEQAQFAQELNADLKTALSDANALLPPGDAPASGGSEGGTAPADENEAYMHRTASGYVNAPIHPVSPAAFRGLREPLAALREEIVQRLDVLRNQEELTYLNPDQSPEEYRAQVAAYYERISREAHAAAPDAAKPSSP